MALKIIGLKHTAFTRERTFEGVKLFVTTTASAKYISFNASTIVSDDTLNVDWGDGSCGTQLYHTYATVGNFVITFTGRITKVRSYNGYQFMKSPLITKAIINSKVQMTVEGEIADGTCTGLKEVVFGNNVTSVGTSGSIFAKRDNTYSFAVERVVFNAECCELGEGVFNTDMNLNYSQTFLQRANIPNGCTVIPTTCFAGCKTLKDILIPEGVVEIMNTAFYGCSSLTSITIPSTVTSVGARAFERCTGLKKADFSRSKITLLDEYVLSGRESNSSNIEEILLPSTITSISYRALNGCNESKLTKMTIYATTPPSFVNGIMPTTLVNVDLKVPASAVQAYRQNPYWEEHYVVKSISAI